MARHRLDRLNTINDSFIKKKLRSVVIIKMGIILRLGSDLGSSEAMQKVQGYIDSSDFG